VNVQRDRTTLFYSAPLVPMMNHRIAGLELVGLFSLLAIVFLLFWAL
jgi:hypothetical protein